MRTRTLLGAVTILLATLASACVRAGFEFSPGHPDQDTHDSNDRGLSEAAVDASRIDHGVDQRRTVDVSSDGARPPDAARQFGAFDTPSRVAGIQSTGEQWEPGISADDVTLYYGHSGNGGATAEIWSVTRPSPGSAFGTPTALPATVNATTAQMDPDISSDGLELYFGRADGTYISTRTAPNGTFGSAVKLSALSVVHAGQPSISFDGWSLYFTDGSKNPCPVAVAARSTAAQAFVFQRMLDEINAGGQAEAPSISSTGLELFFTSTRSGLARIYVARRLRLGDLFDPPVPVPELDHAGGSWDPAISADGRTIYFAAADGKKVLRIWSATRAYQ